MCVEENVPVMSVSQHRLNFALMRAGVQGGGKNVAAESKHEITQRNSSLELLSPWEAESVLGSEPETPHRDETEKGM